MSVVGRNCPHRSCDHLLWTDMAGSHLLQMIFMTRGSRQSCPEAKSGTPLHIQFVHGIFFLFIFQPCAFEQYFPKIDGEFSKYISLKCHTRDLVF